MTIRDFLSERDPTSARQLKEAAAQEVQAVFGDGWGVSIEVVDFSEQNYENLFSNEFSTGIRNRFIEAGKGPTDLGSWLGGVAYSTCNVYNEQLFRTGYQQNRGWRVSLLGLPSIDCGLTGIAGFYGAGQADRKLALAMNKLRNHMESALDVVPGRPVTDNDRSGDALLYRSVDEIAGVGLTGLSHPVTYRHLRTTTVKRLLASFITFTPFDTEEATNEQLMEAVTEYRDLAHSLLMGPEPSQ